MGGLGFLLVIGFYLWLTWRIVRNAWSKSWKWGSGVLVVMVLLPTTDAVIGRLYLGHLCATEGGLHVTRVVEGVDGFYWVTSESDLKYFGYQFMEGSSHVIHRPPGTVARVSLRDGIVVKEDPVQPLSQYEFDIINHGRGAYFDETSWVVRQRSDMSELGRYSVFTFRGGWAEWLLSGFADGRGSVAACNNIPFHGEKTVLQSTLIPKR